MSTSPPVDNAVSFRGIHGSDACAVLKKIKTTIKLMTTPPLRSVTNTAATPATYCNNEYVFLLLIGIAAAFHGSAA